MNDLGQNMARLNITFSGLNGDAVDPVPADATDADIKAMATEMVRGGSIPGIAAAPNANFYDFVVDRFAATGDQPFSRIMLRPKTPFGGVPASESVWDDASKSPAPTVTLTEDERKAQDYEAAIKQAAEQDEKATPEAE